MDVRRRDVDAELHAQGAAKLQFRLEPTLRQHVDRVARQAFDHRPATLATALALLRRKTRAPKRRRIRKLRLLALLAVLAALGLCAFVFGLLTAISAQISSLAPNPRQPQANTYVYANDGHTVLAILRGSQARIVVPSERISPWLKHAIVAAEDRRFYEHRGVDLRALARAVWADVRGRAVQGGSTITQQFVKNAINGSAPTIGRKLRESALAWQLEQKWTKDEILTAYLNTIYFANGAYGVEQACRVYFGHSADTQHVNPAEAALLAGIPEDPSLWDPVAHPKLARARRNFVLRQMYEQRYLDEAQYRRYLDWPMPDPQKVHLPSTQGQAAPYFANYVTDQLVRRYGTAKVYGGGLKVTTTIDLRLQKLAREAIAKALPPSIGPTAALVSIDAHTGAVLAMVGGRNYHRSQFNLATQGERQPGSAFKPFVLAAALRAGIAPATTFVSHPVTIDAGGRLWNVNNYEGEYLGPIDLTKAIAYSDNSVFAQLTNVVGPSSVAQTAADMGITTPLHPYFAIGLGSEPATPLEMARAYTSLADGGYRIDDSLNGNEPRAIDTIVDSKNNLFHNSAVPREVRGLAGNSAAIEDQLLEGVVAYGTGRAAALPDRPVAGKTGTTENYGDAWFVGFTPDIVTAVWVGYPDRLTPMLTEYHGRPVAGGTYPALIWKTFMQKALADRNLPSSSFPPASFGYATPATVIYRDGKLRRDNGNCRGADVVDFFSGAVPATVADCKHNEVEVPDVRGSALATAKTRLLQQPLLARVVYRPAKPGQRVGVVLAQTPTSGTLSSYDKVMLVVARAKHGVVPKLVGLTLARAQAALARLKVQVQIDGSRQGRVVAQQPRWGVASEPGMRVVVTVRVAGKGG
jgi:penicillin-binding protein 1A